MTTHLSRRTFNVLFGSALGASMFALVAPGRTAAATSEITVLNWKGYGTDEAFALKDFAAATGITVKHDYFSSEAEMLTKLRTLKPEAVYIGGWAGDGANIVRQSAEVGLRAQFVCSNQTAAVTALRSPFWRTSPCRARGRW